MSILWALILSVVDIAAFVTAVVFAWNGDYPKATFRLAMSISLELGAWRAWRRAAGKGSF